MARTGIDAAMTLTSGNPTADRRFEIAMQLRERGDEQAALELMGQTLELVPAWPEGRFVLAEILAAAGQSQAATVAFEAYLAIDPSDSMGAAAKLAALGLAPVRSLSPAYVERLFDQYAKRFDKALVEGLKYNAPKQIRDTLSAHFPGRRFARCLDLGCGTGLMGAAIRDLVTTLVGVDLSAGMLAEAKSKNIYDELAHSSLQAALTRERVSVDLILAADVLVYVGDLAPVMMAVATALQPGGLLAFTLQASTEAEFRLGADQRFSHSEGYVTDAVSAAGLNLMTLTHSSFRQERKIDVPGLLIVAAKSA